VSDDVRPARDAALLLGGVLGFVGVACGAMGAHALRDQLDATALDWWKTGAQYAQIHAVLLVAVALAVPRPRPRLVRIACAALVLGIVIFAGTLWAMALGAPRWFGAITPLGGSSLLAAWLALAAAGVRTWRRERP
jgi:uncharacterized membrane protein YgdD (TMEM256/DUF423 family)